MLTTGPLSHRLTAVATSPAFMPPAPTWPAWAKMTGFLFWDAAQEWEEPETLTAFFDGPLPVVAVSSGSMSEYVPRSFDRFYQYEPERRSGHRAHEQLVIGAPPGALPDPLPNWIHAVPYAPFSRIYPRCAAVIHHGGIGTTAQGLQAGVPQMIAPWGADQFFHGAQITRLGTGRWMTRRAYRPGRATKTLRALLTMPRYRQAAQAIAAQIASEDGVATLCDAIEAAMPQPGPAVVQQQYLKQQNRCRIGTCTIPSGTVTLYTAARLRRLQFLHGINRLVMVAGIRRGIVDGIGHFTVFTNHHRHALRDTALFVPAAICLGDGRPSYLRGDDT